MRHWPCLLVGLGLIGALAAPAGAQTYDLAVRTSGTLLKPGDQLRVELVALERFNGPFTAQVVYRWDQQVTVRDEDGHESQATKTQTRTSPRTGAIESLDRFQSLLLDDSLFLGSEAPARYQIEVTIYQSGTSRVMARLGSVVYFQAFPDKPEPGVLVVRGVKRANSPEWVTLDGTFPTPARYSILVMDGRDVVDWLDNAVTVTGPHNLDIIAPRLARLTAHAVDLVIHDHLHGVSTTLAGFIMPPPL